jgi:hypothetical protein
MARVYVRHNKESKPMTPHEESFGPNVTAILAGASRVVRGRIPAQVRRELAAAVKAGVLGRLPKQGLKPEVFYHPDHKHGAVARQKQEAAYSVACIARVMTPTLDEMVAELSR